MKKIFTLLAIFLVTLNSILAQTAHISGIVLDADSKEPLGGVIVRYDKTKGVVTNEAGKYVIEIPIGDHELVMGFDGYKNFKKPLAVKYDTIIDVLLRPAALQLNQVESVSQYRKNSAKETISTEVISAEQIKSTNAINLSDVVAKTPGVLVQDGQISIRGGSTYSYGVGTRTAVLQDGLPLMSADLGEGQMNMANLSNVKQVEVIKGASSVVYGSSALNGVVNMISAWPTDADPKNEFSIASAVTDVPKIAYQKWWEAPPVATNINFNHQERIKNVQYVVGGNITQIKSQNQFNDSYRMQGLFKIRYLHPKIEGLNFGINGSMQFERSERFFISKDLDSNIMVRGAGSDDKYLRTNVDPFVSYTNSKGHRIICNTRYMDIFRKGNGTSPDAVSNQFVVFDQYQYRYKNMLIITAGVPFDVGSSRSNLYSGVDFTFHAAAYTQAEFDYKFLSLQGGLRYEASGVDTTVVSNIPPIFRAGINLQAAKATFFRASWGQGFRVPSIGEKYIAQQFTGDLYIVPNDTLRTERSWSMELGFKQGFKIKNWIGYIDAAFFWQQSTNFIEYTPGFWPNTYGNGKPIFPDSVLVYGQVLGLKPLNIQNTRLAGYEISIQGAGNIGPLGATILAGYTYDWPGQITPGVKYPIGQFLKDMFTYNFKRVTGADENKIVPASVRHLVRGDMELSYWKMSAGVTVAYASTPESIPPLFQAASIFLFGSSHALTDYYNAHRHGEGIVDVRIGMKVNDQIKLGFIIKNVGDVLYELRPGIAEPLRNYTLQFTYTFGRTSTPKKAN
jgi:outer membrane receptor protein involved in Fe transport